jgi:hypothetical protein
MLVLLLILIKWNVNKMNKYVECVKCDNPKIHWVKARQLIIDGKELVCGACR